MMRGSGIILPVFSLPGKYGIGDFSKCAAGFADWLSESGQTYWQMLPLGPTGYGDSPYQPFSSFAGNPYFISPEILAEKGLIDQRELKEAERPEDGHIDYGDLYQTRYPLLKKAFARTADDGLERDDGFSAFREENADWLDDYCLYRALKDDNGGRGWLEWDEPLRKRDPDALGAFRESHAREILFYAFLEYEFDQEWRQCRQYVNEKGIRIIGDLPIYISMDSADAWADPALFSFDREIRPALVAGCPPDGFMPDGQLWGNPVYQWERHEEDGFAWWRRRLKKSLERFDILRLDHFRGFESFYAIPAGEDTAAGGHWEKGPGMKFFNAVRDLTGEDRIIAEDLGYLTPEVEELLEKSGFPGMKVLQFAFDNSRRSCYLPCYYGNHCVAYTGTHDNNTLAGYLDGISDREKNYISDYVRGLPEEKENAVWTLISLVMGSAADTAIVPMQDYLALGGEARINTPGTGTGNWSWRLKPDLLTGELSERVRNLTDLYCRC